jgi:hypothetical protein
VEEFISFLCMVQKLCLSVFNSTTSSCCNGHNLYSHYFSSDSPFKFSAGIRSAPSLFLSFLTVQTMSYSSNCSVNVIIKYQWALAALRASVFLGSLTRKMGPRGAAPTPTIRSYCMLPPPGKVNDIQRKSAKNGKKFRESVTSMQLQVAQ